MKFNLTSKVEVINVIKLRIILKQYIDKTIRKKIEYITLNWIFEVLEIYIDAAWNRFTWVLFRKSQTFGYTQMYLDNFQVRFTETYVMQINHFGYPEQT